MEFTNSFRWYILFTLVIIFNIALVQLGVFSMIWAADITKLSFLILGLFLVGSLKCGYDLYSFEKTGYIGQNKVDFGWFLGEILLGIGMVGTVIGFIVIMKDFSNIDFSNLDTVKELIKNLGSGVSTALYTTLSGLVGNILLKVQYFLLESATKENE